MEKNSQWPGQAMSLKVDKVLLHEKTDFQDLMVFQSTAEWGKVLVLDGVIQLTERDECSYQEMLTHLPMFSHEAPKQVLIIGGGDGGVLREVCRHDCVEKVTMVDIDKGVVEASKKFFPAVSTGFSHPKANLIIGDGVGFVTGAGDATYDVIVVDSSDPVGPAEKLFSKEFYEHAHRILRPGGVLCTQSECLWLHAKLISNIVKDFAASFDSAEYASMQVPTYPCGQLGAFLGRKAGGAGPPGAGCRSPRRSVPQDMKLRYYTADMHAAAFALPAFMVQNLDGGASDAKPPAAKRLRLQWETDR